jgi:curved DNA-binding protein CbpA
MNYYQQLGVLTSASKEEINDAYKKKVENLDKKSAEHQVYNYIYKVLMNDYERGLYDAYNKIIKRDYDIDKYYPTVSKSEENYKIIPTTDIFDPKIIKPETHTYESYTVNINGDIKTYEKETKNGVIIKETGDPNLLKKPEQSKKSELSIEEIPSDSLISSKSTSESSRPSIEEIDGGYKNKKRYRLVK